jgi:cell division protein FtsI (penicillin-binding protein 3)
MTRLSESLHIDGVAKGRLNRSRSRLRLASLMFAAVFAVLGARLVQVTIWPKADAQNARNAQVMRYSARADIVDRNGELLATDLTSASLYADARLIWDAKEIANALMGVAPELDRAQMMRKLSSRQAFVWIKRDLTAKQHEAVYRLGFPSLGFRKEPHRVYPHGRLAAHALGYVDIDNAGLAGIERGLNARIADPKSRGAPVVLSLDVRAQHALQDELSNAMESFKAIAATGLILKIGTGEVIGMASLPDYDPNEPTAGDVEARFNRATQGVFEMGSTLKIFTTAMVLDSGAATLNTKFDARRPIQFGRFQISDFHAQNRIMTLTEVFQHSSNIGSARMAMLVAIDEQRAFLDKMGLLKPVPMEVSEVGAPLLPLRWGELESMTVAYGHGIAVTPIQLAAAAAGIVNGGRLTPPTMLKRAENKPLAFTQVVGPETAAKMKDLLRLVVTKGTGGKADVAGYPVAGKTGTAEKPKHGGYAQKALLSSFLGVFPAQRPEYLVLIILDEPKPNKDTHGFATAGWTAAPTAAKVIARIGPLLKVPVTPIEDPKNAVASIASIGELR